MIESIAVCLSEFIPYPKDRYPIKACDEMEDLQGVVEVLPWAGGRPYKEVGGGGCLKCSAKTFLSS